MARARNIKPGVMENEDLAELDPIARLLFIYLWMLADREGRLEDRPKKIKAKALPYDSVDADAILADLHAAGFIVRYEIDGTKFIQIANFLKHQKPHSNETESEIPPCFVELPTTAQSSFDQDGKDGKPMSAALGPCISDSLIAGLSDSLDKSLSGHAQQSGEAVPVENSAAPQAAGASEGDKQGSFIPDAAPRNAPAAKQATANGDFETAWGFYPKRGGGNSKTDALKAWTARVKQGKQPDDMIAGVMRYAKYCEAKGNIGTEYVKQAATFFGPSLHFEESWDIPTAQPLTGAARPAKFDPMAYIDRNRTTQEAGHAGDYIDM